ncbi:ribosomal protein S8 (nucleomorph) [Bigelowiella natans]|uniref:Ribosomal protein S8 n=1 Tax=Bigelowiella natans TaxID=227086 RepID=Q3LWA5_BIGNA|nr:ribosomal protein S8 [Bigelowiella natans]ABA27261.1 ribosomal protein S8 [Bigelowiella natans]|mmetsp:Transcript_9685/g.11565  ORF Transcript_9685/g.11565 Transcript_9685/m.11565 type:complete len:153 (+) Transcript_9685:1163-1621(+)
MGKTKQVFKKAKRGIKTKIKKSVIKTMTNIKEAFKKGTHRLFLQKSSTFENLMTIKQIKSSYAYLDINKSFTTLTILSMNVSIKAKIISIYSNDEKNNFSRENSIKKGTILIVFISNLANTLLTGNKTRMRYAMVTNDPAFDGCINSVLIEV